MSLKHTILPTILLPIITSVYASDNQVSEHTGRIPEGIYSSFVQTFAHQVQESAPIPSRLMLNPELTALRQRGFEAGTMISRNSAFLNLRVEYAQNFTMPAVAAGGPPPFPHLRNLILPNIDFSSFTIPNIDFSSLFRRPTYLEDNLLHFLEWHYHPINLRLNFENYNILLRTDLFRTLRDFSLASDLNPSQADVVGQEALTTKRQQIHDAYIKMATQGRSAHVVTELLPEPNESLSAAFDECHQNLDGLLDILLATKGLNPTIQFRFQNAKRTLRLLGGDESIEHHAISSVQQYERYSYPGLPNIRQLFILACRLGKVDTASFVELMLGELCNTEEKWRKWAAPFYHTRFHDIVSHENIGQALEADRSNGHWFIKSFVDVLEGGDMLPTPRSGKAVIQLMHAYIKKKTEQMMPVIEGLFMIMRGHNIALLDSTEQNRPACAEGAYLGFLRAVTERMPDDEYFFMLEGLTIERCS